jgi:hypothetical protein
MKEVFKHLVTCADGCSHDLGRWSWVISMAAVLAAAGFNGFKSNEIDLVALATALGAVAGAHGLALWAKKDTEPKE